MATLCTSVLTYKSDRYNYKKPIAFTGSWLFYFAGTGSSGGVADITAGQKKSPERRGI
jgi:hypothetical protein